MIIRSKFESVPNDRKKLSITNSRSSIFKGNLQKSRDPPTQKKSSILNHIIDNSKLNDKKNINCGFPVLGKQNIGKSKSISVQKSECHQQQKGKVFSIIELLTGQRRLSKTLRTSDCQKGYHKRESRKLKVENLQKFSNNEPLIKNYQNLQAQRVNKSKIKLDSFQQTLSFEYDNDKQLSQISFLRQSILTRKSCYPDQTDTSHQKSNQKTSYSNFFGDINKDEGFVKQKFKWPAYLSLDSLAFQIKIEPKTNKNNKISVEIQTVQAQKQLFDYLRYKRKQSVLETELTQAFTLVSEVKEDRSVYEERVSRFLGFNQHKPENERQERVFKLKDQISKLQRGVQQKIIQKCKFLDDYTKELEQIGDLFASQNQKILRLISKYKESCGSNLFPEGNRTGQILAKVQKSFRSHIQQTQKKVNVEIIKLQDQILKGKTSSEDGFEVMQLFREYIKTVKQQKTLLRNCFGYIKKIPQLCYGLLGDQLPNLELRKENDILQMPKCMQCYNSQWKLHMIIQKNQLMKSIFKVIEELFK